MVLSSLLLFSFLGVALAAFFCLLAGCLVGGGTIDSMFTSEFPVDGNNDEINNSVMFCFVQNVISFVCTL
jgi:phosphotransferase system  glucose/maltose/N-acetylglucosamine-specific IIC component